MSKILVIAEHAEGKLNAGLAKALAAAQKIGGEIDVAVLAADGSAVAAEAAKPVELMQGPSAPGTALAQDDVDSLLADLGF